jgi:hypothetical protein
MWWDEFVPKIVMEERLDRVTGEFTRALESEAAEIRLLQARLQEIQESGGWKFVLWSRKTVARLFPPNSLRGRITVVARRAVHVWLDRGSLFLAWAMVRKTFWLLGRRVRISRTVQPAPAPVAPTISAGGTPTPPSPQVVSPPEAPPVMQQPIAKRKATICLYTSSIGNYFFHEMRDLFAAGLEELGVPVELRCESDGFGGPDAWHVVIAPHEFFHLGAGEQLGQGRLPANFIVINTEQPSTQWFRRSAPFFPHAKVIWDIDYLSSQRLFYQGWNCRHLALGHVADFRPFRKSKDLPDHYGTCFLEPRVRQRSRLMEPLAVRPLDLVFFGNPTPRRHEFFARAASLFANYRCYFHFSDHSQPLLTGQTTYMNTSTVVGLVQRAKILLNVHRDADLYFEWQRIVMQGIWHRTLVLSERCSPAPPFRPGVDYIETPLEEIPARVEYYLSDPVGRQEAQVIATDGQRTLERDCRMRDLLAPLIAEIGVEGTRRSPLVLYTPLAA